VIITVNGEERELPSGATVATLADQLAAPARGLAIALDGEVVPRGNWPGTPLVDGARVEVVVAVQGG
jgi:sulfur carrier protein